MLICGIARNDSRTESVVDIARFSRTDRAGSGESGEHRCRCSRGVGRVGIFFSGHEGLSASDSLILYPV